MSFSSDDVFLSHVLHQTLYNATQALPNQPKHVTPQQGECLNARLAVLARRLHELGKKYGISSGAHFYARWILALPLLTGDGRAGGWRRSLQQVMQVRASYLEHNESSGRGLAVVNHAVIAHLCAYESAEPFQYATHLAVESDFTRGTAVTTDVLEPTSPGTLLPLTWNMLLTTTLCPALRPDHQDTIFTLNALLRRLPPHSTSHLPPSPPEQRLNSILTSPDHDDSTLDDSYFTDCIHAKPSDHITSGGALEDHDPNTLMAVLKAHLALKNGNNLDYFTPPFIDVALPFLFL